MSFVVCPVCLEALHLRTNDQATISCGHVYHYSCLRRCAIEGQTTCPQCRQPFQRRSIQRLHFSTLDFGSVETDLRQELDSVQKRLKETEKSCAIVLEQSAEEQKRIRELQQQQSNARQEFRFTSADVNSLRIRQQLQLMREELRQTKTRLKETEAAHAATIEQSSIQESRLTESLRQAREFATTILDQASQNQEKLRQSLNETQRNADLVLEQVNAEQARLQDCLRKSQASASEKLEESVKEQSRLQETLRQTKTRADVVLEQSVLEQSRLEGILRQLELSPAAQPHK